MRDPAQVCWQLQDLQAVETDRAQGSGSKTLRVIVYRLLSLQTQILKVLLIRADPLR